MSVAEPATQTMGAPGIAGTDRVSLQEIEFIALIVAGWKARDAYLAIKPDVKPASAKTLGNKWAGRLRNIISRTTLEQALSAFGDIVPFEIARDREHPERLAAAKELSKLAGRYDRGSGVSDLAALVNALSTPNQAQIKGEGDAGFVAELSETVDLTRPEESGSQ